MAGSSDKSNEPSSPLKCRKGEKQGVGDSVWGTAFIDLII
jgi:hypothetical protein